MGFRNYKMYCGNGRLKKDKFGNEFTLLKMTAKDIEVIRQGLAEAMSIGGQHVSIAICKRKEASKYGDTLYGIILPPRQAEEGQASPTQEGKAINPSGYKTSTPAREHRYSDADLPPRVPDIPFN